MQSNCTYYRRNLPHYHPEDFPLFITFRLADSLPKEILENLKQERERELKNLQTDSLAKRNDIETKYFNRFDEWLDRYSYGPLWLEQILPISLPREFI